MKQTVQYVRDDFSWMCKSLITKTNYRQYVLYIGSTIAALLAMIWLNSMVRNFFPALPPIVAFLIPMVLVLSVYFWFCTKYRMTDAQKSLLADDGAFLRPKTIELSTEGITEFSDLHRSFTDWRAVQEIRETDKGALFMVDNAQAFIFPKRAVAPAEYAAFLKTARDYHGAAH